MSHGRRHRRVIQKGGEDTCGDRLGQNQNGIRRRSNQLAQRKENGELSLVRQVGRSRHW